MKLPIDFLVEINFQPQDYPNLIFKMKKLLLFLLWPGLAWAQQEIALHDLSAFDHPSTNWTVEQSVIASSSDTSFQVSPGKGILVNTLRNGKYKRSDDLKFKLNHGDIRLMLDFMLPKGANSGIYLQGRYEVQLFDSYAKKQRMKFGDCGGIYERWDDTRGKGNEGYEGYAPRQNACKAPGLWQTIEIEFQSPRFDATGKKIQNAIFKKVILNGVLIQENIEVSGMTRGALFDKEAALGPIIIQGDHGPIAFKNIKYETYEKPSVSISDLNYSYYEGAFTNLQANNATALLKGKASEITGKIIKVQKDFLLVYEGQLHVPETDTYEFISQWTGKGRLEVDGQALNQGDYWYSDRVSKSMNLTAGKHSFKLSFSKDFSWGNRALGLFVKRIGSHVVALHARTSLPDQEAVGLIEVKADAEPVFQRSFAFHQGTKKTHVIHVGDPAGVHYSYDLNQGSILQVWRGKFLNATQMWENRGEPQTAEPMGLNQVLDGKFPLLPSGQAQPDSINQASWVYKGYRILQGRPIYMYQWNDLLLEDTWVPNASGTGWTRTLSWKSTQGTNPALDLVLTTSNSIEKIQSGLLAVDSQHYFIQWNGPMESIQRLENGRQQARIPVQGNSISYQVIW